MEDNGVPIAKMHEFVAKLKLFLRTQHYPEMVRACFSDKTDFFIPMVDILEVEKTVGGIGPELFPEVLQNAMKDIELPGPLNVRISDLTPEDISLIPEDYFDGKTFVPKRLADQIMKAVYFKTLKGNEQIYRYDDGLYKTDGIEEIRRLCVEFLGDHHRIQRAREVASFIKGMTYIDPSAINNEWVNLNNGLLNPTTKEFRSHTPEIFTTARVPIDYDPEATCPLFEERLQDKIDAESYKVVQEMFGYCLLPGQRYEVAFLFYGPPRTMKSTTLFVLEKMLGSENTTAFSLQTLNEDRFASAYLYGKIANVCADLSKKSLGDTGIFIRITGGDSITAARKNGHNFTFHPSVKLIFSCNTVPPTSNKHLAFYRRWIPLPFNKKTDPEEIDSQLKEKLLDELPGILNWSLEGLERLVTNNKFSFWLDAEGVKDVYEKNSDSVQSFIYNGIDTEDDTSTLTKREVYAAYIKYCQNQGLSVENPILFGRDFKAHTGCGTCKVGKIPGYSGVKFKGSSIEDKTINDFGGQIS